MFDVIDFNVLVELAKILAMLFSGGLVVPLVNKAKELLKLSGYSAFALSAIVAVVFAVALAVADGQILEADLKLDNLASVFAIVFASAQGIYLMIKGKAKAE